MSPPSSYSPLPRPGCPLELVSPTSAMWDGPHICRQHPDGRYRAGLAPQGQLHGAQDPGLDLLQPPLCQLELVQAPPHLGETGQHLGKSPDGLAKAPNPHWDKPALPSSPFPRLPQGWPEPTLSLAGLPSPPHTLALWPPTACTQVRHPQKAPLGRKDSPTSSCSILLWLLSPQHPRPLLRHGIQGLVRTFSHHATTDLLWVPRTQSQAAQ